MSLTIRQNEKSSCHFASGWCVFQSFLEAPSGCWLTSSVMCSGGLLLLPAACPCVTALLWKTSIWMNFSSKGHRGACLWVECQKHVLDYPSGLCHRQTQKADAAGGGLTSWSTQGGGCGKHAGKKIIIKANACGQRSSLKLSGVLWHLVRLLRTVSAEKPSGNFSAEHIRGRVLSPVNVSLCILIGGL